MLDQIQGLPTHPLVVHLPVVLIPLTLLLAILAVSWPRARRVLSLIVLIGAAASMLGAQIAVMSGGWLEENVRETAVVEQHAELGDQTRALAILMFLAAVGFVAREWSDRLPGGERLRRLTAHRGVAVAMSVVLLATAVLTTVWVVRTGHMGAKAAWSEVPAATAPAAGTVGGG